MKIIHAGLCVQPPPINGFQQAFIDVVGEENYREISCGRKDFNQGLRQLFDEFKPEIVFTQIQTPNIISKSLVKYMYESGAKIISWSGDVWTTTPQWMIDIAPYCITSFSNMVDVKNVRARGYKAEWLEIGYDPLIYNPVGEKTSSPEIVFMGNHYGQYPLSTYRMQLVGKLQKHFGERFGVYGNGWSGGRGENNNSQRDQAKIYRNCKIAINCSQFNYERYSSDRLLRILGSGAFCLSHHFKGIEQVYLPGVHLDTFNSLDGMINKINYYLEHEEERNKIAKAGQQLVLHRNTFKHQVENIIKLTHE